MLFCSVNGQPTSDISITDRAFNYGDGLFTTALIKGGYVKWLQSHIERLKQGCEALAINHVDWNWLSDEMNAAASKFDLAVLKVVISAGQGGRGYSRNGSTQHNIIISVTDYPEHYQRLRNTGLNVSHSQLRLSHATMLSGIKHLNRLEQVLIRRELDQCNYDDLLVADVNGVLVEASCANVFWRQGGKWFTPRILDAGISGIYRKKLLTKFADITEVDVKLSGLKKVEAMIICNCIMGGLPVKTYLEKTLDISLCTELDLDLTQ